MMDSWSVSRCRDGAPRENESAGHCWIEWILHVQCNAKKKKTRLAARPTRHVQPAAARSVGKRAPFSAGKRAPFSVQLQLQRTGQRSFHPTLENGTNADVRRQHDEESHNPPLLQGCAGAFSRSPAAGRACPRASGFRLPFSRARRVRLETSLPPGFPRWTWWHRGTAGPSSRRGRCTLETGFPPAARRATTGESGQRAPPNACPPGTAERCIAK